MEVSKDYLFKVVGIERVKNQVLEEEITKRDEIIKKLEEEKETIQKALKKDSEDV